MSTYKKASYIFRSHVLTSSF